MPQTMWKGTIGFGLVNVPVELVSASRDLSFHFRELHEKDGAPVRHHRFCTSDGEEVRRDEIGHGYEVDGTMIVITDQELEEVQPDKSQTIEIESFADLNQIDPIYFDHQYFLKPGNRSDGTLRAYRLLVDAIEKNNRVALGRFVMRTKEYLAGVRSRDGVLALSTMLYTDEIRSTDVFPVADAEPDKEAVKDVVSVIDELTVKWNPADYTDCYRQRLEKVIDSKRKGETVKAPEQHDDDHLKPAPDLMAALRKTLEQRGKRGGKAPRKRAGTKKNRDLSLLSRYELYELAQAKKIPGRSSMSKKQLTKALNQG